MTEDLVRLVSASAKFHLTDGHILRASVALPDVVSMLMLKTLVRTVRSEDRDVADLWRCLEIAAVERVEPATFDTTESMARVRAILWEQLGPNGSALTALTAGLQSAPAARLRTRVRALVAENVGPVPIRDR